MNKLSTAKRVQVVGCLVEGMSIRATVLTVRITGVAKNTVTKLLADIGSFCSEYQNEVMRDLQSTRVECDEIWAYCYSKVRTSLRNTKGPSPTAMEMCGHGPPLMR